MKKHIIPTRLDGINRSDYADCTDVASAITLINRLKDYVILSDASVRNQLNQLIDVVESMDQKTTYES